MQLRPREYFTIFRGLEDHTDSTTYFVRAVIRNAKTQEIIETVPLTDEGDGHRFSYNWQVPADISGEGFYIIITSSVYTDPGYEDKSTYGDKFDTYLVQDRMNPNLGTGGGVDIDYKKIRAMIAEELSTRPIPIPEKIDIFPLRTAIDEVKEELMMLDIPKPEKVDLSAIESKINMLVKKIDNIVVPIPKDIDFTEVLKKIDEYKPSLEKSGATFQETVNSIRDFLIKDISDIKNEVKDLRNKFSGIRLLALGENQDTKKQEKKQRKFF